MRHGALVVWFAVTALVAGLLATGLRAERVVGATAPSLIFDVAIPHEAFEELRADDVERSWRRRLTAYDVQTELGPDTGDGDDAMRVRVTVIGADGSKRDAVLAALTSSARLELVFVAEGDRAMQRWYAAVRAGELPDAAGAGDVEAELDAWMVEDTGSFVEDPYLRAPDAAALARAVAALEERYPLAPDQRIGYERVEPYPGADRMEPYVRTYLLERYLLLTNRDIAEASVTYSRYTGMPEVMVELTDRGARAFGDATAANVGRKLAILVDGRVVSAPVIQGVIRGGRVSITMGGGDPPRMEREAADLAAALGSPTQLPAGIEARLVAVNDRPMGLVWALRALAALLAGAVAVVIAIQSRRRRWFTRAPEVARGRERWDALAIPALVTFLVPALLWYAAQDFPLPGINPVELASVLQGDASIAARASLGVFALGIMPVASAFILVELYAILVEALVPARRGRRLGTPADRRRLDRAAWILVGVLALLQAYFLASYIEGLDRGGTQILVTRGKGLKWLLVVTLAAGVMVQITAAELISRRGLANGYLVLLASAAAVDLAGLLAPNADPRFLDPDRPAAELFVAIAAAAAAVTIISTRVRSGERGPRLPYTGVVPASLVRGGLGLVALAALWSDE
ncbi:MAG: hypothetical protein K8M05_26960, partial [Deltaproteobacteria bacterium]|nr:hypothetical protein [Kofleriaceae bacterium]